MTFTVGQELEEVQVTLAASMVNEYISVVDDQSSIYAVSGLVPMTALAAIGLRTLLAGLGIPPGAIHIAQELESHGAARVGQSVLCRARVAQASRRREATFAVLEFTLTDDKGESILEGRTTLLVPEVPGGRE